MESQDAIFLTAREIADPAERAAYLSQACGKDADLRQRVEAMLRDAAGADEFFGSGERALSSASVTEGPGTVIGRFKLLEKIGEGGMGVVYMAEQREPVVRKVALKIIKLGMDTRQVVARFEAERQALAMMDHPNIARVLDGGATESGRPYFVMELVPGLPITQFCDEANLSTRDRLDLFLEVCSAIQHAHQKGIIHRDIKPSNIQVTLHGDKPVPKVIDFGVAKATQGRLTDKTLFTQFQQFVGTPAYMSPEQASLSGLDIDTRSDIYALGVLLYELLTGRTPFDGKELLQAGLDEMRRTIREKQPPRPSNRISTLRGEDLTTTAKLRRTDPPNLIHVVRGDLDWIVMKALEKDRARRYETANGLAMDIKRHINCEPVVARPPSAAYKLQKAWRRNKLAFTAAVVVAVTLVVGITVSSWQAIEAGRARNAEKQQRQLAEKREAEVSRLLYVANMNVAQQAWDQNNIARLRQILEETQGSPYRGFEWNYWQPQTHMALMTLRGHLGPVSSVAVSRDGRRIATGSLDTTARVWDAASGRELLTLEGHRDWIVWVAFSPDGRRIVTASHDQTARVWDADTGRELFTLKGHRDLVRSALFSPDGRRIVTCSYDQTAKVWNAATGRELLPLKGHSGRVWAVAFSPDSLRIVTGGEDSTAKVWDAASGTNLLTLKGHSGWVVSAAFSPDGQRIVTGSYDLTVKVWEAASGRELLTLRGAYDTRGGISVGFSPDGQKILTGSEDHTAKVWEAAGAGQVAAWQKEEQAAVELVAAEQLERTREQERQRLIHVRDSIKQWLVLAPIALGTGQSGTEGLDIEQIQGESQLRPKPGDGLSIGGRELKWTIADLKDYVLEFDAMLGQVTPRSVAYAVCYIQSQEEQRGLQMLVGSQDEAKVYLNGKEVYKAALPHGKVEVQETVQGIVLSAGLNTLVFKVVSETPFWKGSIEFKDAKGNQVKGIKVTLDPEAKNSQ